MGEPWIEGSDITRAIAIILLLVIAGLIYLV